MISIKKERIYAIKIVCIYAIIAKIFVYTSDYIIGHMFKSIDKFIMFNYIKCNICIVITCIGFYIVIDKYIRIIKNLKNEIEVNDEQYKFVINNTTGGLWCWDVEKNHILFPYKWKSILGYKDHEISNSEEDWFKLIHPDDYDYVFKKIYDYMDKKTDEFIIEYRMRKKDGTYIWVLDRGQGIWDENGRIIKFMGTYTDITEMKESQIELKQSEEKFKALFHNAGDAIALIQLDNNCINKYIEVNKSACERLGYTKEELLNMTPYDIRDDKSYNKYKEALMKLNELRRITYETIHVTKNGTKIPVEINWHLFDFDSKKVILSIARDITQRKEANDKLLKIIEENEELLEKTIHHDRIKTEFFCNMSHEFKTPLNVILGTIQLLNTYKNDDCIKIKPEKFNKYINMANQNCLRLLRLINNIMDITKLEYDSFEIKYRNYNIIYIIESITQSVVEFAKLNGIDIIFDTDLEEKIILCDADIIERIILNILSNSIKNTDKGGCIWVNIYNDNEGILITIKDDGIGIPKDKIETIFDRFTQVDGSLKRKHEGSGVGLSLVKSLVEKHNGHIWVTSEVGIGTQTFIRFPYNNCNNNYEIEEECSYNNNLVEKINIEFSDIYSL
ncbi:sensor histidine kinase [Tepidibacter hydrothermalis]|uniref:histidine kinase n=1 Tax=Tepidibacter hydrothermalis TaxID=3036126 RepID=A0ABY8EB20_9FIRM|nr:PAS domain S-box protein [Tepidibacter hydrothermalis]WFD09991.1 PAS domain S-box protein [Tepidibacter hydrothermalis]